MSKDTWSLTGGREVTTDAVATEILRHAVRHDGLTISGGEPFLQPAARHPELLAIPNHRNAGPPARRLEGIRLPLGRAPPDAQHRRGLSRCV
mgnify:CR=1 FL=1